MSAKRLGRYRLNKSRSVLHFALCAHGTLLCGQGVLCCSISREDTWCCGHVLLRLEDTIHIGLLIFDLACEIQYRYRLSASANTETE